jgi:SAM-dependent methyltransferase
MNHTAAAVLDPVGTVAESGRTKKPIPVTLCDGSAIDLATLGHEELLQLHWVQERAFADRIRRSTRTSPERAEAIAQGYDTVCTILHQILAPGGEALVMGMDQRIVRLVTREIERQTRHEIGRPRFFELGYGSGGMLQAVREAGGETPVEVAGIEVSATMREQAFQRLPAKCHAGLMLGDFLAKDLSTEMGTYSLIYWNDVFEHIPTDEIEDFLEKIHGLLRPGGKLVTVTPNWHRRPSDVTGDFMPPRTEARGFHLREYTLGEVTELLQEAGFIEVATPLFVTRKRIVCCGQGLAGIKRMFEPSLEWLPFGCAKLLCRGLGLSCTIARKGF